MSTIAKATARVRNTRRSCFLTHGADSYDKRGLKKAHRSLDRAIVNEWLEESDSPTVTRTTGPVTFRVVIVTQVYENYGAHCWDGTGDCPQYWKAKGGNEYHRNVGSANEVLQLGRAGIDKIVSEMRDKVEKRDDSWDEYAIDWLLVPSNEETYDEQMYREMLDDDYFSESQYRLHLSRMAV